MTKPELTNSQIEIYRHDLEIIRNTAHQLIKDLALFGIELVFNGKHENAYEELKEQLTPIIDDLQQYKPSVFRALLYRIDVDEKKVNQVIRNSNGKYRAELLSNLILEKEFMKTLYRKLFS